MRAFRSATQADLVLKKKAPWFHNHGAYLLERDTRFELATSTLARSHSTTELVPQTCTPAVPTDALYSKSPSGKSTEILTT